ncbi:MAG: homoprotocatechuate degradation operon regulator HpaR [Pseudomonadota bacterium]
MADGKLRSFERSLPMALLRARESVMRKFLPTLKAHDLSAQQWRVIRALHAEDGLDMSELAQRCYLLLPSLTRIVRNLEQRALVSRTTVASDARRFRIFLSTAGRDLFRTIAPHSEERYQHITQTFGAQRLEQLYALLDELVTELDAELGSDPDSAADSKEGERG